MSGIITSIMEFEAKMDGALNSEIIVLLDLLECQYQSFAKCELKGVGDSNCWLIECCWLDEESMRDHFQSKHLQDLIRLLASRSSKIRFESLASANAK